jgi:hypothetical protein
MPLFLLEHNDNFDSGPPFDQTHSVLVRAPDEKTARGMIRSSIRPDTETCPAYGDEGPDFWQDSAKSTCKQITEAGSPEILHVGVR